jgi:hypothetical protein
MCLSINEQCNVAKKKPVTQDVVAKVATYIETRTGGTNNKEIDREREIDRYRDRVEKKFNLSHPLFFYNSCPSKIRYGNVANLSRAE